MNGILLVDKPQGFTSFDVIAKLRGILKIKRLGHAGTLDPIATGVLPVFVGKSTRACDIIPNNEKSYTADFALGKITDTQDITGNVVKTFDKTVSREEIENILNNFKGCINQLPPMYSAVSVNGKRLYDLARQGIEVERQTREVFIENIKLIDFDEDKQTGRLFIACSKGTYIRTIIHDIGNQLLCGGVMTALVRNSSSGFKLDDCHSISQIEKLMVEDKIESIIIPVDKVFESYAKIELTGVQTKMYKNGVRLDLNRVNIKNINSQKYRVYSFDNEFLGIASENIENMELVCDKNFF